MDITFVDKRRYSVFRDDFLKDSKPASLIDRLDDVIAGGRIVKDDKTTTVAIVNINDVHCVVKRFNNKGLIHSLRHSIKGSRAGKCWKNAAMLLSMHIATPRPLAYVEIKSRYLLEKSYYITEYIKAGTLRRLLKDENVSAQRKQQVLDQVQSLLEKLHNNRITHGDMKHTNILITETHPLFTDLDAMRKHYLTLALGIMKKRDKKRFLRNISSECI